MKLLAALTAGALALVLVALYLGDTSGSSTPTTNVSPTPVPAVRPKQEAIDLVAEHVPADFGDNHVEITAENMLAGEAYVIARDMGIGELNIMSDSGPTCPPGAFGCGAGRVSESAPGYLVLVTGIPVSGVDPETPAQNIRSAIQATWISDGGIYLGIGIAYPSPTALPGGSLLVERTDWALTSVPESNTLSITVAVGGSCDEFDRIATSEDENTVTIHAYIREQSETGAACTAELRVQNETVQLDAPLGNRTLIGCNGYQIPLLAPARSPVDCRRIGP
jgi:hypothetical protein